MNEDVDYHTGFCDALVGDGRPLLKLTAISLIGSGLFAFFLAATGHFLPHDILYLGMSADELHAVAHGRLAHFMMHDRVSFGGAIFAIGILYLWLAEFPLRAGKAWAWWTFLFSGIAGFASFLSYLGYGYLDSWHGAATLVLLPIFAIGMYKSHSTLRPKLSPCALLQSGSSPALRSRYGIGRLLLLVTAWSLVLGGMVIMTVGMTRVFVPQDLDFMQIAGAEFAQRQPTAHSTNSSRSGRFRRRRLLLRIDDVFLRLLQSAVPKFVASTVDHGWGRVRDRDRCALSHWIHER